MYAVYPRAGRGCGPLRGARPPADGHARGGGCGRLGFQVGPETFFDTITVAVGTERAGAIHAAAEGKRINLRRIDGRDGRRVARRDRVDLVDLQDLWQIFNVGQPLGFEPVAFAAELARDEYPAPFTRTSEFLTHPVFNKFHTETEMLRYTSSAWRRKTFR